MPASKKVYQLKITLEDSRPAIWRRVLVPADFTLDDLHDVLQDSMGWEDSHLHEWTIARKRYSDKRFEEYGFEEALDEARYTLAKVVPGEKEKFTYLYDFGDGWSHTILVEKILTAEEGTRYPVCIAGKRACPPEDVGGIYGYAGFLEAYTDPRHEDHEDALEWAGEDFDPEHFDPEEVNQALQSVKDEASDLDFQLPPEEVERLVKLQAWTQSLAPEQEETLVSLPVRRDMLTFLKYLGENRTVGTSSTGNLPLKAVRALAGMFVHPVEVDETIGDRVYKLRTEDEVWPLLYIHLLAHSGGLVTGGPSLPWELTPMGHGFTEIPAPIQVHYLMFTWWHQCDWTAAFPFAGLQDELPEAFGPAVRDCLLELPAGKESPYEEFADRAISQGGLTWKAPSMEHARENLHWAVRRMVIEPLASFGVLEGTYKNRYPDRDDYKDLIAVRLTPLGRNLLELL